MDRSTSARRSLLVMSFVVFIVVFGTIAISLLARGYRFNYKNGPILSATGILSATSGPKPASVYINGRLVTATDDTLYLPPGDDYQVKISKDGYLPWEKMIKIKKEVVYQTNAELFRTAPDLKSITLSGAINAAASPDGSKIVYAISSASAEKDNGLYLLELVDSPLSIIRNSPRQLFASTATVSSAHPAINWSQADFTFSPNSQQILAYFPLTTITYLIQLNQPQTSSSLIDITSKLPAIREDWQQQQSSLFNADISKIPSEIRPLVASQSARSLIFSTNDDKVLYLASTNGSIPNNLITAPPAQSTQKQSRNVIAGNYYVYDLKDDTNFLVGPEANLANITWLPNTDNFIYIAGTEIKTVEYDGTNRQTLFAGNFDHHILTPWIDGTKIIILTSPFTGAPANLYTVSIK